MKRSFVLGATVAVLVYFNAAQIVQGAVQPGSAASVLRGIPLKPDPPFAVDGDLSDWADVPNVLVLDRPEQVVWGRGAWQSPADLSGKVQLAWRREHLFLAVSVTDDQLRQTQQGDGIWRGDHVELYLDVRPDADPSRKALGAGQFQFAFSPGNFRHTGDALADCRPEAYCFRPSGATVEGVRVGARRTEQGWTLEAAVPWSLLGVKLPARGYALNYEVGISDTDTPEPKQESMMTTSTARWAISRDRFVPAVLAGSDGVPPVVVRRVPVFDEVRLAQGQGRSLSFTAPAAPEGRDAVLVLEARLDTPKVAGHTPALRLILNGKPLAGDRLLNKPRRAPSRGGQVYSMVAGDRFTTYYTPDFKSPDSHPHYGLLNGIRACLFELRVTDLLRVGQNTLEVRNAADPRVQRTLVAAEARLEFRPPPPPAKQRASAPSGPLPVCEVRMPLRTDFSMRKLPENRLEVQVSGRRFIIESRFSTPRPGWVRGGDNPWFRFERRIEKGDEAVIVRDTFTNLTNKPLALMHRYEIQFEKRPDNVWLAGLRRTGAAAKVSQPANPTTFAGTGSAGIGLLPLNDVFRVHTLNYLVGNTVGLADNNLALAPRARYTAEWAIVPADSGDYWRFINAARRLVGANFTIDGAFAFFRADPRLTGKWSDEQTRNFLLFKDVRYACASISYPRYKGRYLHGTAFQKVPHDTWKKAFARRRRLVPTVKNLVYFHCFLDVTDDAPERFADARILRPDGSQADYGRPWQRLFFPSTTNSYGPAIARNVDIILDDIGADGVYWDEHEYSAYRYHYGKPWDGFSCDIEPKRMTVARLKSSVTLLSEKWRVALAKRILARGPLIGNGPPVTRAMAALDFPCFVETGSITNCARAHLYSPIALGDHLTERSEQDAYGTMLAALDYGCVYHWYNDVTVIPTHHHLTRYMFPITPLELHAGYIIGRERIVTKKSGLFGWGDDSKMQVHVFDHTGREVKDFKAPILHRDGKTLVELRLPGEWSAAIVRVPGG